jgi:hypothetical protein
MQEPTQLEGLSTAVNAVWIISMVLAVVSVAVSGWRRRQLDPNGGIFALLKNRPRSENPDGETAFKRQAKLLDCLCISQLFVVVTAFVLSRYRLWSFVVGLGIYQTLSQVSSGISRDSSRDLIS